MSERERALAIIEKAYAGWGDEAALVDAIEEALRAAREEERRRCAEIAWDINGGELALMCQCEKGSYDRAIHAHAALAAKDIAAAIESGSEKAGDRDNPNP